MRVVGRRDLLASREPEIASAGEPALLTAVARDDVAADQTRLLLHELAGALQRCLADAITLRAELDPDAPSENGPFENGLQNAATATGAEVVEDVIDSDVEQLEDLADASRRELAVRHVATRPVDLSDVTDRDFMRVLQSFI